LFVNTFFTIRTRTEFRNFLCLKFNFVSIRQYTLTVYLCEFLLLWKYISVYDKDVRVFQLYDYLKCGCYYHIKNSLYWYRKFQNTEW